MTARQRRAIQRLLDLIEQINWDTDFPMCLLPLGMLVEDVRFRLDIPRSGEAMHSGIGGDHIQHLIDELRKENVN